MISGINSKKWIIAVILAVAISTATAQTKSVNMWQTTEWSYDNPSYQGNPFDVIASATFTHIPTNNKITTQLFHNGGSTWKFRFTGTQIGKWTFNTSSEDPDLNALTGEVAVLPNPDKNATGFLHNCGNKFAVQTGNDAHLEGYLFTVYMQRKQFDAVNLTDCDEQKIKDYCKAAKDNGFEIVFFHINNQWLELGKLKWSDHKSENPDLKTFEILDKIITTVHSQGCRVHLWAWGDESRGWTPIGLPGGINGKTDRRLQRYIAARLGPLPGWTLGYGFDLHEWVSAEQLNSWAKFLHDHFGYQHLLCARGSKLEGPDNMISYSCCGRSGEITTTDGGPKNYQEVLEDFNSDKTQPHFYEERHSYLREGFKLDMDGTRRLLWWQAMVGGMGGFFGFYPNTPYPYPNPEQLRCHYTFWHTNKRFLLESCPDNDSCSSGAYVLKNKNNTSYVVYQQDCSSIEINLSEMKGSCKAVAVDTKKQYQQQDLGKLKAQKQTIQLPNVSDWAIAIGDFKFE